MNPISMPTADRHHADDQPLAQLGQVLDQRHARLGGRAVARSRRAPDRAGRTRHGRRRGRTFAADARSPTSPVGAAARGARRSRRSRRGRRTTAGAIAPVVGGRPCAAVGREPSASAVGRVGSRRRRRLAPTSSVVPARRRRRRLSASSATAAASGTDSVGGRGGVVVAASNASLSSCWKPAEMRRMSPMTRPTWRSGVGQALRTEHDQGHQQDHQQLAAADVEHGPSVEP